MTQAVEHEAPGFYVRPGLWTAQRALAELPETSDMVIEVIDGSLIVSPRPASDHAEALRELAYHLHRAAREAGYRALPEINLVIGKDLTDPDITVVKPPSERKVFFDASEAVLVVEIMSPGSRRKDRIERPPIYAEAGIQHYLRVEFRNGDPVVLLHELIDGEYRPVSAAAAGSMFRMSEPFAFEIDPAVLRAE